MIRDWRPSIVQLAQIKQAIFENDKDQIWQYHLPRVGASEIALTKIEEALGFKLDSEYREFLAFANGWPAFYQSVTLFGTSDLKETGEFLAAKEILGAIDGEVLLRSDVLRQQLFPIAGTSLDLDVFVMCVRDKLLRPPVIWLAGDEVDRYDSFSEFFSSMIEYNQRELLSLTAK